MSKTIQTIYKVKVWPLGRGGTPELFYFDHPDLWVDFIGEVRDLGFEYKVNYDKSARLYRSKHDDDQKAVQRALSRVMDIATAA